MTIFRHLVRFYSVGEAASSITAASETTGKYFKVKLYRGFIGLPEVYRKWASTLGLRKRGQTAYVPIMPVTMGAIIRLKELLKVDIVEEKPASINPVYPKGYKVVDDYLSKPVINLKPKSQ